MSDVKSIRSVQDLTPDHRNANRGTQRGRGMVEESLRKLGAGRSILVDKDGRVIAGNKTLEAWADLDGDVQVIRTDGRKLVVVQRTDLDLTENTGAARRLAYFDNQSALIGIDFDPEQIAADIEDGLALDDVFYNEELDDLLATAIANAAAPEAFAEYGDDIETEHECPKCGYTWS